MLRAIPVRYWRGALYLLAALAGACQQETVSLPASDSTPPSAVLDVFNLPPQGGSTPGNPETVTSTCCSKQFKVRPGTVLTLSAAGSDPEGVRIITIFFEVVRGCEDPQSEIGQQRRAFGVVARNASAISASPGVQVPVKLNTAGNFSLAENDPGCLPEAPQEVSLAGEVWATAVNFFGLDVETKRVELVT